MSEPNYANKACPKCGGELVIDDTSNIVYCERNSDHYRSDVADKATKS